MTIFQVSTKYPTRANWAKNGYFQSNSEVPFVSSLYLCQEMPDNFRVPTKGTLLKLQKWPFWAQVGHFWPFFGHFCERLVIEIC